MIHMYCTECPGECYLEVTDQKGSLEVTGNKCPNGIRFAREEITCPKRVLTSTVLYKEGDLVKLLPVRTDQAVPLGSFDELMEIINSICVEGSMNRGEVIVEHIAGLEVNLISSARM